MSLVVPKKQMLERIPVKAEDLQPGSMYILQGPVKTTLKPVWDSSRSLSPDDARLSQYALDLLSSRPFKFLEHNRGPNGMRYDFEGPLNIQEYELPMAYDQIFLKISSVSGGKKKRKSKKSRSKSRRRRIVWKLQGFIHK